MRSVAAMRFRMASMSALSDAFSFFNKVIVVVVVVVDVVVDDGGTRQKDSAISSPTDNVEGKDRKN